ncbi:MAG: formylmethanofuran dehydrogenase subunit E family protein [Candidatus Omnitrophota bacterium]
MKTRIVQFFAIGSLFAMTVIASETMMHTDVPYAPVTVELLERFHGHLGPNVALGACMGEYAIVKYGIPRYFGVTVEVECPKEPPVSCIIDGLQMTTGATYGKKNIIHIPKDEIQVAIQNDRTKQRIVFQLKPSTKAMLKKWAEENMDVEERGLKCFAMKAEDLFDIAVEAGQ